MKHPQRRTEATYAQQENQAAEALKFRAHSKGQYSQEEHSDLVRSNVHFPRVGEPSLLQESVIV